MHVFIGILHWDFTPQKLSFFYVARQPNFFIMLASEPSVWRRKRRLFFTLSRSIIKDHFSFSRWRNWFLRGMSGSILISGFSFLIYCGPIGLFFLVKRPLLIWLELSSEAWFAFQTYLVLFSVYSEVMGLAQKVCKVPHLKSYAWYNFYVLQYFMNMDALWWYLGTSKPAWINTLIRHHELISFALYMGGLIYFVLKLNQHYMRRWGIWQKAANTRLRHRRDLNPQTFGRHTIPSQKEALVTIHWKR